MTTRNLTISGLSRKFDRTCRKYESVYDNISSHNAGNSPDIHSVHIDTGNAWEKEVYDRIKENAYSFLPSDHFIPTVPNDSDWISLKSISSPSDLSEDTVNLHKPTILVKDAYTSVFFEIIRRFLDSPICREMYFAQLELTPDDSFYADKNRYIGYLFETARLETGYCDLVYISKEPSVSDENDTPKCLIRVCDIKSSLKVKLYHKIQTELYCEILESRLNSCPDLSDLCTISDKGYIWIRPIPAPEPFRRLPIINFLKESLPIKMTDSDNNIDDHIYSLSDSEIPFVNQSCEGCKNLDNCIRRLKKGYEILLSPNLSEYDALYLRNHKLTTTESIRKYLTDCSLRNDTDFKTLKSCNYFSRLAFNRDYLEYYLQMIDLRMGKISDTAPVKYDTYNNIKYSSIYKSNVLYPGFPVTDHEDIQLYLCSQYEEYSNRMVMFAIYGRYSKAACRKLNELEDFHIVPVENDTDYPGETFDYYMSGSNTNISAIKNLERFISRLSYILRSVSEYNDTLTPNDSPLTIQGYVADDICRYSIEKTLYDYLDEPGKNTGFAGCITDILQWIQNEKTSVYAPQVSNKVYKALLDITDIAETLFVLSSFISNNLDTIARCLGISDPDRPFHNNFYRFSNSVNTQFLYEMYNSPDTSWQEDLKNEYKFQLQLSYMIIRKIRERLSSPDSPDFTGIIQNTEPPVCVHIESNDTEDDTVRRSDMFDRLRYILKYERFLGEQDARAARLRRLEEGIGRHEFYRISCIAAVRYMRHSQSNADYSIGSGDDCFFLARQSRVYYMINNANGKMRNPLIAFSQNELFADGSESRCYFADTGSEIIPEEYEDKVSLIFRISSNQTRKLFDNPAMITEDNYYRYVPAWHENDEPVSDTDSKIHMIKGRFRWIYSKTPEGDERSDMFIVDYAHLKDISSSGAPVNPVGKQYILLRYYDAGNDKKLDSFFNTIHSGDQKAKLLKLLGPGTHHSSDNRHTPDEEIMPWYALDESDTWNSETLFDDSDKQHAYDNLCRYRISEIIGAPGTGKTYFIGKTVSHIMHDHDTLIKRAHTGFRILVTSNSWTAIENMLEAISAEDDKNDRIFKLTEYNNNHISYRKVIDKKYQTPDPKASESDFINELKKDSTPYVIGTTCWQLYKLCYGASSSEYFTETYFDLLIIDEATQMRLSDALISLSRVQADTGRVLIVGDENQLGAIIRGKYETADKAPNFTGSVFRLYYEQFVDIPSATRPLTQLNICRRMNEVFTRYLADNIYGSSYSSFIKNRYRQYASSVNEFYPGNKEQCLSVIKELGFPDSSKTPDTDQIKSILKILDPEYQMVVCYLKGGPDKISELREAEKELVSQLSVSLNLSFKENSGNASPHISFKDFWGDESPDSEDDPVKDKGSDNNKGKIGVISPYNRLNEELPDVIADRYGILSEDQKKMLGINDMSVKRLKDYIKCATVDKFQGQERDIIIACYGERNIDSLLRIKEFVYSKNRLNVVISRAKSKCILILSELVATRYPECYENVDDSVIEGVEFICGLKEYMTKDQTDEQGIYAHDTYEFTLDKVKVSVYRKKYSET